MKLIAQIQLKPTGEQSAMLRDTVQTANRACDFISSVAWSEKTFGQYSLHKLSYADCREKFDLSAQMVVRCISKVADAYKLDKKAKRTFKPMGAIAYDDRILRYKLDKGEVSIWTTSGRQNIPFACGKRQWELLQTRQGESDLAFVKGKWYLMAVCNVEEPEPSDIDNGVIGVDFGIVEIATTSEGKSYSGEKVKEVRRKLRSHRARLQKCGTHSAKRKLRKASRKQANFVKNSNHCISKELVSDAKAERKALVLEDLKGIRERANGFNREMRWQMGNWAFFQLRTFVEYKSKIAGVKCVTVDPRNTSRTCAVCGHCEKSNRKSQEHFKCLSCGHTDNADMNAAINISKRAAVNRPIVLRPQSTVEAGRTSPRIYARGS